MSHMLNKSNQLPRETSQITTSFVPAVSTSSNSNMNGPHNNSSGHIIPVLIPQRNLHQVNQSLVQSPQTLILSDTITTQSGYPTTESNQINFQKTPHLSVKVLTNPSTNHHTSLVNGMGQGICLAAPSSQQSTIPSQIMTTKGSMTMNQSSSQQAPHLLPKQQRFVNKMKLNQQSSQSNQQNSNSPIPIYPSMNQSNLKDLSSRLVIHQKTANPNSSTTQAISFNQNNDLDGNSSSAGPNTITSIPVVNANSRQVNLMMVTNNLSTSASGGVNTNSLIIGNSTFPSNQLIKNQSVTSSSSSIMANQTTPASTHQQSTIKPLVNISHQSINPTGSGSVGQSISLNNVFLTNQQGQSINTTANTQQGTGLLIKQQTISSSQNQQSENQLISDTRQIPVSIVVGSIGTTGRVTANSLPAPIKMDTNNGTIVSNSVSSALIRGMSVNQHSLANSFISSGPNQLHQTTPSQQQQQQHQKIQQHNTPQNVISKQQFTSYANSAAAVAAAISKKRSRKQVLQTGSISSKSNQGQSINSNNKIMINSVGMNDQQKHQPGPTTALLITTSNNNNSIVNTVNPETVPPTMNKLVTIGSTSTTTCATSSSSSLISTHQIQMATGNNQNNPNLQQSSNIFGFRLVPMKSNMPSSTSSASSSSSQQPTPLGSIRLNNAQSLPANNNTNNNHQIYISPSPQQQPQASSSLQSTSSSVPSNSMEMVKATSMVSNNGKNEDLDDHLSKALPDEHEIAESLIKTCNELENHKKSKVDLVHNHHTSIPSSVQSQPTSIISVPPSNAKATHFLTHSEVKLKSLSSLNNGFLSYLSSELLDDEDYESTRGKKMTSKRSYPANNKSSDLSSHFTSSSEFKKESYILWNSLFDLRIKQSSTQFVRYPIATSSPFDVTGWRLLQSTNNLEFLKNLEFYACSSLHNMESILTDYISFNKDSLINPSLPLTDPTSITHAKRPRIANKTLSTLGNNGPEPVTEEGEEEEEDIKPKKSLTKSRDFILKLEKTLEFLKGLEQRQKILWERMSGIIDMTNGLMQNHRYPALQIFDDLSLFISHVNQRNNNPAPSHEDSNRTGNYNGIEAGTDSDEATQSEESMIKT